jgi:NADH:ubiquinone oxidoreductase subunit 5 (subunit L)/multisubunit Na+/H+ antiporter MnhA subunit
MAFVLTLPITGFLSGKFFGRLFGSDKLGNLATIFVFLAFVISFNVFFTILSTGDVYTVNLCS